MSKTLGLMAFLLSGLVIRQMAAQQLSPEQEEVWKGEQAYFRYLQDKNLKSYMALWDDRFVGWPDYNQLPVHKPDIETSVREELQSGQTSAYPMPKPEAITIFGDVAVTYYFWPETDKTSPHVYRITHTWQKGPKGWHIIGGMGCEVPRARAADSASSSNLTAGDVTSAALDPFIQRIMDGAGIPGLQTVVVKQGRIVWSHSYGSAVLDAPGPPRPMTDDSIILIASTSKLLVPIAVLQQVEKGRLSLDDDINRYVPFTVRNPKWPDVPITWRMLLTHTSSIDEMDEEMLNAIDIYGGDSPITFDEYMKSRFQPNGRFSAKLFRQGKPGSERIYSNDGISLAAFAVEKIVHESFDSYVQREILTPLRMHATSYSLANLPAGRLTVGYGVERKPDGSLAFSPSRTFWKHQPASGTVMEHQLTFPDYPSGRIYTTATDYARLMMMFLNGGTLDGARILSQASVNLMFSPSGYRNLDGWQQGLGVNGPEDLRGRQVWGHDGQERGYSSAFYINPQTHMGAIAFANGNYADFTMNYGLVDLDFHLMEWFEQGPAN